MGTNSNGLKCMVLGINSIALMGVGFAYMFIFEHNLFGIFFGIVGVLSSIVIWKEIVNNPTPFIDKEMI